MDRKIEYIIIILGILKAGACFVPLDKNIKESEVVSCFHVNNGRYLFTDDIVFESILPDKAIRYECVKEAPVSSRNDLIIKGSDLAYIIFTSATTGTRKGVMIEHKSLQNLVIALNERVYELPKRMMRIGVVASFSFDASIKQIFYSLYFGHTLVIAKNEIKYFGRKFIDFLNSYFIEIVDVTPSLIQLIAMDMKRDITHTLKKILVGGEKLTTDVVKKAYQCFGDQIRVFNMYGPTECCVDAAAYEVKREDMMKENSDIPIGRPLKNISFTMKEVDENGVGELYISGIAVGRGYTNSSTGFMVEHGIRVYKSGDLAYVDKIGNYHIVGRKDHQVKVRGVRLELEGIDACIKELEGVSFSYTILEKVKGRKVLVSFIQSINNNKRELDAQLREKYPDYMIPNYIIFVDHMKLNSNGKVDHNHYKILFQKQLGIIE